MLAATLALRCACSRDSPEVNAAPNGRRAPTATAVTAVTVAAVRRMTLTVHVSAPGSTTALQVQDVRAPFAGVLSDLLVHDGDKVEPGQVIGHLLSQDSAAALEGARAMLRSARTAQERSDAQRALSLAEQSQVAAALRSPAQGVVVSHRANAGALVSQDEEVITVAASAAIVFVARVDQDDLSRVRPGETASVQLPALRATLPGRVHSILPLASPSEYSVPVRIDFGSGARPHPAGLFGTARIAVAEKQNALTVPVAAVFRDDVTGVSRVARVTPRGTTHWTSVKTGVEEGDAIEIVAPTLKVGERVITSGLVGLPEGAHVQIQP